MRNFLLSLLLFASTSIAASAQNWKLIPKSGTLWLERDFGYQEKKTLNRVIYTTASVYGNDSLFTFRDKFGPQWLDHGSGFIDIDSYTWRLHNSIVGDSVLQTADNQVAFRVFRTRVRLALLAEPGDDTISGYLPPFHKATIQLPNGIVDSIKSFNIAGFGLIRVSKSYGLTHIERFKLHHDQNFPKRHIDYTDRTRYREIVYRYETSYVTGSTIMDRHVSLKPKFIRNNYLVFPYRDSTVRLSCSFGNCSITTTANNLEDTLSLTGAYSNVNVDHFITSPFNSQRNQGSFSHFILDSVPTIRKHYSLQSDLVRCDPWSDSLRFYNPPHMTPSWLWQGLCSPEGGSISYNTTIVYFVDTLGNAIGTRPTLTSLTKSQLDQEVNIYPNPAADRVTVAVSRPSQLEVINTVGMVVRKLELAEKTTIEGLHKGFYLFKITQDGVSTTKRVVVR